MGNTQSTGPAIQQIVSAEEIRSRLRPEELDHLQQSYDELLATPTRDNFVQSAFLGFPENFSDRIFKLISSGAGKTTFDDVLTVLGTMVRGSKQEKLHLLFLMVSGDGNKVSREEIVQLCQDWECEPPANLDLLFTVSEQCTFQHFAKYINKFNPSMGPFDWVLSNEDYGFICTGLRTFMTYHKFLAEQASFTERQVMALEKRYRRLRVLFSTTKRFDLDSLYLCFHPLYSFSFTRHFFSAIDLNGDGNIDCRELVIGLSAILEGEESFAKFVFAMFDTNMDGILSGEEIEVFAEVLGSFCVVTESLKLDLEDLDADTDLAGFTYWCTNNCSMYKFNSHLRNIVYVVFGVRPDLMFNIVRQWMELESNVKLILGKTYYLACSSWFKGSGGLVNNSPLLDTAVAPGGAITNNITVNAGKPSNGKPPVPSITSEGGLLREGLLHSTDYQIISQVLWCTLEDWYGCARPICRRAKLTSDGAVVLDLFPLKLNFYRSSNTTTLRAVEALNDGQITLKTSIELGSMTADPPRHVLSYTGAFYCDDTLRTIIQLLSNKLKMGREDLRLWRMLPNHKLALLEDSEERTLEDLGLTNLSKLLIEERNDDMSWPEEVANIISQNRVIDRRAPHARVNGTTGLNNLGNTCFMNSSIQCLSNTRPLSVYFLKELHLREVNMTNPDNLNGLLALRYGTLVKNLWSCTSRTIAPLKMRWTINKFAGQFSGFGQHDSQELLAFLLDGLHEDLNRVASKPYTQIKDSAERPDAEVASEFWVNHTARNRSIIVDLFHGQLKSTVRCMTCNHTSVRFDPFSSLSLPMPENENTIIEVFVVRLDPANPCTQYCLWLNTEYRVDHIRKRLQAKVPEVKHFLFLHLEDSMIKRVIEMEEPLRNITFEIYAFELPGTGPEPDPYVMVYSRHYSTIEKYFFDWQHRQVSLFGTPFVIPSRVEEGSCQSTVIRSRICEYLTALYSFDEEFAEELLFEVRRVKKGGRDCETCPWKELCYGHKITDDHVWDDQCHYLTVDWSSAVVHLIRQFDDDVSIIQDSSVADARRRQSQPVDLSACLNSFTKEEEIAEWYCSRCSTHRTASKKLDIWRLPPVLIIHLKRFSFEGGKWVKCQRTVSFPDSFDPSPFLVQSSQISLHDRMRTESVNHVVNTVLVERFRGGDIYDEVSIASMDDEEVINSNNQNPLEHSKNSLAYITNAMYNNTTKVSKNDARPFYDLYAVVAHTGLIGHGHYVSFALNPNKQWYFYNDSQVKKTTKKRVLSEPAYILFYERRNLHLDDLLPCYTERPGSEDFTLDASVILKDVLSAADKEQRICSLQ